jgi:photosystem II stability/assembly factor-like uncharacterized protein/FtsZ-binding cell division protein ZapB
MKRILLGLIALSLTFAAKAQEEETPSPWDAKNFEGLKMRSVGPAFMAGRIADIAIHPDDESTWYVAVGSGGVWKTENAGTTWSTIFDDQSVFSTGCITIDPNNPSTVWLGTGENVGGRHVGYGDGIYRSTDGGKKWKNMGLKASEHISKIIVHPSNSNVVWVAAQGPLWSSGGERGFYKTTDGGETWTRTLGNDEWTGVTDIVIDPRNPNHLYAATWDRHRTIAAYLGGGPGTGLHRSTDGGDTWEQLKEGLPEGNMGKIGLAISPQNPDVLYAAIELNQREGGVYQSTDKGSTWTKQSDAVSGATGPHYYQELYASPHKEGRIYLMDVRVQISEDGGKTFRQMNEKSKHSDNHAMAFKMSDPDYLLFGTDGGMYESYDLGENWRFFANMPITQFYKLAVDDSEPFYNIYGGTQDNNTQGGPSRTDDYQGIQNSDWKVVLFADGHQPATEPGNPDIMYAQWQEGALTRIDMSTGEVIGIQPFAGEGEKHERYNWDAPILVSSHKPTRIYHGSYRLWQSDDRGDNWTAISGDLTRDQNRLELDMMGRTQSYDNAWDLYAMSTFNTITSIAESPHDENVIYIGTDDGLMHRTDDMGANWTKMEVSSISGVPATAYVNDIKVDLYDPNTVYVALDNHKHGDLKPYLFKSTNKGKSWTSLTESLPEKTTVWRIVQDHKVKDLLFIATEFGIYFSVNGGTQWTMIKGGVPTISFRDLTIQRREDDLVGASFGRSFYVFDDMSVFREITEEGLAEEAQLFPTRKAWWYIQRPDLSFEKGQGSQGAGHYLSDNPPFGAVFTYHLAEGYKTAKDGRSETEKEQNKAGEDVPFPGYDQLDAEANEMPARVWLEVADANGNLVRRVNGPTAKGFHRVAWDLKLPPMQVVSKGTEKIGDDSGLLVAPGTYQVRLMKETADGLTALSEFRSFEVVPLHEKGALENPLADQTEQFHNNVEKLALEASILRKDKSALEEQIKALGVALAYVRNSEGDLTADYRTLRDDYYTFKSRVDGSPAKNKIGEKQPPAVGDRMGNLEMVLYQSTYGPTGQALKTIALIEKEMGELKTNLEKLENRADAMNSNIVGAGGPPVEGF